MKDSVGKRTTLKSSVKKKNCHEKYKKENAQNRVTQRKGLARNARKGIQTIKKIRKEGVGKTTTEKLKRDRDPKRLKRKK